MIREITGMLVTAIAIAKTSRSAVRFCAVPSKRVKSIAVNAITPTMNGTTSPATATVLTTRVDDRLMSPRICVPAVNMRSRRPSWYTAPSTAGTAPVDGNSQSYAEGHTRSRNVGPRRIPPTISPITGGCRKRAKR